MISGYTVVSRVDPVSVFMELVDWWGRKRLNE